MSVFPRTWAARLFLLVLLPAFVTASFGTSLVIGDAQAELHIDPQRFLERIVWAWNPDFLYGTHTGFSHVYNTPYTWLYVGLAWLHVPAFVSQLAVMFLVYLTVGWGMYVGLGLLAPRLAEGAKLAGCAAFACTMYVAFNSNGSTPMLLAYAAIPLFVGVTVAVSRGTLTPLRGGLAIGLIVLVSGGFNPPLIAINLVCAAIAAVVWLAMVGQRARTLRRLLAYAGVSVLAVVLFNAYWIVPFLDYMRHAWIGGVLDESAAMHNADTTYVNVLRGLGQWSIFQNGPNGAWYAWAPWYASGPFAVALWLVPLVGALGLVRRRLRPAALVALLVVLVSVPMVTGYYTGNVLARATAAVYDLAYRFVPLFQMFRSVYKWVGPVEFGFGALYAFAVGSALAFVRARAGRAGHFGLLTLAAFCVAPMIIYLPVVFAKANGLAPPLPAWIEAERSVRVPDDGRVALLPGQYLEQYLWGNPTYYLEDSTFPQSLLFGYLGSAPNEVADQWMRRAYRDFRAGEPNARADFEFLGTRLLVDRQDFLDPIDFAFVDQALQTDASTPSVLLHRLGLKPGAVDGANVFYPLPSALPRVYVAARATVFPGLPAALINTSAADAVLHGRTYVAVDDVATLRDHSAFATLTAPSGASFASEARDTLASRASRVEIQSPSATF
ncbi:MAG: alpha-(1-_3)-arabinofuranosyltransferase family protein, partial [Vulcanimicrobiaceae bacterium]